MKGSYLRKLSIGVLCMVHAANTLAVDCAGPARNYTNDLVNSYPECRLILKAINSAYQRCDIQPGPCAFRAQRTPGITFLKWEEIPLYDAAGVERFDTIKLIEQLIRTSLWAGYGPAEYMKEVAEVKVTQALGAIRKMAGSRFRFRLERAAVLVGKSRKEDFVYRLTQDTVVQENCDKTPARYSNDRESPLGFWPQLYWQRDLEASRDPEMWKLRLHDTSLWGAAELLLVEDVLHIVNFSGTPGIAVYELVTIDRANHGGHGDDVLGIQKCGFTHSPRDVTRWPRRSQE
jgi:hypothetical protein